MSTFVDIIVASSPCLVTVTRPCHTSDYHDDIRSFDVRSVTVTVRATILFNYMVIDFYDRHFSFRLLLLSMSLSPLLMSFAVTGTTTSLPFSVATVISLSLSFFCYRNDNNYTLAIVNVIFIVMIVIIQCHFTVIIFISWLPL